MGTDQFLLKPFTGRVFVCVVIVYFLNGYNVSVLTRACMLFYYESSSSVQCQDTSHTGKPIHHDLSGKHPATLQLIHKDHSYTNVHIHSYS